MRPQRSSFYIYCNLRLDLQAKLTISNLLKNYQVPPRKQLRFHLTITIQNRYQTVKVTSIDQSLPRRSSLPINPWNLAKVCLATNVVEKQIEATPKIQDHSKYFYKARIAIQSTTNWCCIRSSPREMRSCPRPTWPSESPKTCTTILSQWQAFIINLMNITIVIMQWAMRTLKLCFILTCWSISPNK